MSAARTLGLWLLAGAALAAFCAPPAQAQAAPVQEVKAHEVREGDTLFGVARAAQHDGVTRNQMILAIFRANQSAFPGGNVNFMAVGTILNIPPREVVAAIASAEADRQVRDLELLAASLDKWVGRYREGLGLERDGDDRGALTAFLEAGEGGYGFAQRKLGQIYDNGNAAVPRDYLTSLKWYQKAREQGVDIATPLRRMPSR